MLRLLERFWAIRLSRSILEWSHCRTAKPLRTFAGSAPAAC
jgi:hypothetical protein